METVPPPAGPLRRRARMVAVLACIALALAATGAPPAGAGARQTEKPGQVDPDGRTGQAEDSSQPGPGEQGQPEEQSGQGEPGASGATGEPGATGQQAGGASMQLVEQTAWVHPGEQLQLAVRLSGVTPDMTVSLDVHGPLESRTAFTQTLEGDQLGDTTDSWGPTRVTALMQVADGVFEINYPIPGGDDGVGLGGDGVYPVEVTLADASGSTLSTIVTYLLLLPPASEEFPPLSVATIVELGAPPALQPSGTVALGDESVERYDERARALVEARDVPLTVAPVPETVDALATAGGPLASRVSALESALASREVLARPYVDVDLDAIAAANLVTEVPPLAEAGADVIRTQFNREPRGGIWLTEPTIGQGGVDALRQLAVGRAVVPQSAVTDVPEDAQQEGPAPTQIVTLTEGGPQALVVDEALSSRLTGTEGRLDAQRFLAELMTIQQTRPARDRAVVVRIPADADIDPDLVSTALAALQDGQAVEAATLGQAFDELAMSMAADETEPVAVGLAPDTPSDDLSDLATPLHDAQMEINGLATTLDDIDLISSLGHSLLLALGVETPAGQRRAYIARVRDLLAQVGTEVRAPDGFTITLTAREGTIPLTVINDSDRAISVRVRLRSSQLEFPDGRELSLSVPPNGQVREDVRVRTRASGAFTLDVELVSPDGSLVISEATFTVRSTAVSGVGLVLSMGAGLFLLIWWARHWRSARRSRRLIETDPRGTPAIRPPSRPAPNVPANHPTATPSGFGRTRPNSLD